VDHVVCPTERCGIEFREERMDGKEFDNLARKLGTFVSRRRALGGLAAGALAAAGVTTAVDAKGKTKNKKVGKAQFCANGCVAADGSCQSGLTQDQCGAGGASCIPCGAQACTPNQSGTGGTCNTIAGCSSSSVTGFVCTIEPPNPGGQFQPCTGNPNSETCCVPNGEQGCNRQNGCAGTVTSNPTFESTANQCQVGTSCTNFGTNQSCGVNVFNPVQCDQFGRCSVVCGPPCATGQNCSGTSPSNVCIFARCNAQSCPNGCCDANGTCTTTFSNTTCRAPGSAAGAACVNCAQSVGAGSTCGTNGFCTALPTCQQTCTGCCDATGRCLTGTSNNNCGSDGDACVACPSGTTCNANGDCAGAPPPPTCSSTCVGCCSNNQCLTGTLKGACGLGGIACVQCNGRKKCKNGVCKKHKKHHKH